MESEKNGIDYQSKIEEMSVNGFKILFTCEMGNYSTHEVADKIKRSEPVAKKGLNELCSVGLAKKLEHGKYLLKACALIKHDPYIEADEFAESEDLYRENPKDVIYYLNEKAGKSFRTNWKNINLIENLFRQGYTLEDCKNVIDVKVAEWQGTRCEPYIRPATLFGPKFDDYLNQVSKVPDDLEKLYNYGSV